MFICDELNSPWQFKEVSFFADCYFSGDNICKPAPAILYATQQLQEEERK